MAHSGPNSANHSQSAPLAAAKALGGSSDPASIGQSINGWQSDFVEAQYAQYQADPNSVGPEWLNFFRGFELGLTLETGAADGGSTHGAATSAVKPAATVTPAATTTTFNRAPAASAATTTAAGAGDELQRRVDTLIQRYRTFGHLAAQLDPLGTTRPFP